MKKLALIHGWGVSSKIWDPILPSLEEVFDVFVVDLPGYGNHAFHDGDDSTPELGILTQEILMRLPEQATIVGWSLGATVAMTLALEHSKQVEKLVLVAPTPKFLSEESSGWQCGRKIGPFEELANQFEQDYAKALKKFLLLQSNTSDRTRLKVVRNTVRDLTDLLLSDSEPNSKTLRDGLEILAATDLRDQLQNIKHDTLVMSGAHDNVVPTAASKYVAETIPNAKFCSFDSGHMPFLDQPEKFVSQLQSFLGVDR